MLTFSVSVFSATIVENLQMY